MAEIDINLPVAFQDLVKAARYKIYYGGRGGAKSWSFAQALVGEAYLRPLRILCTREFQNSIQDSVHRLITDQITALGFDPWFKVTQTSITSKVGSQFIFKGLQRSIQEIKSTEGIDICWVEEAQVISEDSWEILIPTIRAENSEIWISFNPQQEEDPTYQRFVINTPPNSFCHKVGWQNNPNFPNVLDVERLYMLKIDPEAYQHVWEGYCRQISDAVIFRGRFEVNTFDEPNKDTRFYYGIDWGFSQDPQTLIRCFISDNILYIDQENYGLGVELDDLEDFINRVPGAKDWPIKADNARPETISHARRRGFAVDAAPKWSGSVEDGIAVMKGFEKIVIHERCKHTAEEFRLYSYKVDKQTNDILPKIEDKHNHCIDAGTLVATLRGDIPIEDVVLGDYALTRDGYKQVLFSGPTGYDRPVVQIDVGDKSITCTPDHRIFQERKGFTSADALRYNDTILTFKEDGSWLKQQSIKARCLGDIQTVSEGATESIISDLILIVNRLSIYIGKYGKNIMAQYLQGVISIIKMRIQETMTLGTLSAFPPLSISGIDTNGQMTEWSSRKNTLRVLGLLPKNGMRVQRVEPNIEKSEDWHTSLLSPLINNVNTVSNPFPPERLEIKTSSARTSVNQHGEGHPGLTMKKEYVPFAVQHLLSVNTEKPLIAPGRVRNVQPAGTAKVVYDLTVDGEHEFFANGILVHNCIDAIRYALAGVIKKSNFFDECNLKTWDGEMRMAA